MNKYYPLGNYLDECKQEIVRLNYGEIEKILCDKLPNTVFNNKAWWSINDCSHVQSISCQMLNTW